MAFVRKVITASGATAVQVVDYVSGRQQIVAHVGSAHTEAELGVLEARARDLLADPDQLTLDMDVQPEPRVSKLLAKRPRKSGQPSLLPTDSPDVAVEPVRDGPGRVVATHSGVLFEVLAGVFTDLGFDRIGDKTFRDLVIARVVEPTSLLDTGRVLTDLGQQAPSYATMKRSFRRAEKDDYRSQIAAACFDHARVAGDISLVLYDVTTLYFEAEKEDDLRKVGYSKERRVDPQVVVGLLVDRAGFPLEISCFAGNTAETGTIVPVIRDFTARHNIADVAVVADAGMLSATNLQALDQASMRFIVGSRQTKAPLDLQQHFQTRGDAFTDGQIVDTLTPRNGRRRKAKTDSRGGRSAGWDRSTHPDMWRAIWAYSAKRARRDTRTLDAQQARAQAVVDGAKPARTPRFVKVQKDTPTLDTASLDRARRLVGLKGYVTNIENAIMTGSEVINAYHDLWQVEASFRMSKTDLAARPMFHHTQDAINAHLTMVFAALAVAREAQNRTGKSIRHIRNQLRPLRSATIAINGTQQTFKPRPDPEQQDLLDQIRKTHALSE